MISKEIIARKKPVWMNDTDQRQFAREFNIVKRTSSTSITICKKKLFGKEISCDQHTSMIWINNNVQ